MLPKNNFLYLDGEAQKQVYFVTHGLLGRTYMPIGSNKRSIYTVATPGMAMFTTRHLYSNTPSKGDIVSLRPHTKVIQLSYAAIKRYKTEDRCVDILSDVLAHKKQRLLMLLLQIIGVADPFQRYLEFAQTLPELVAILTQIEQAELLGISRKTVQRAQYFLLTGRRSKN